MTRNDTELLIQKYLNGETTAEEERMLALEVSREDAPEDWKIIAGMLGELTIDEALFDQMTAARKQKPRIIRLWPWLAAACVAGFMLLLFAPPETQKDEALQAQQDKERYDMERQLAYVRTSCEQVSFESLEREMRGKGEQLMAEYRNQINTLETE